MESILDKYLNLKNNEIKNENKIDPDFLINYDFKLPIEYNSYNTISDTIKDDIELKGDNNIINLLLNKDSNKYNFSINKWSSIYSTDKHFIKDNQKLLKKYKYNENNIDDFIDDYVNFKSEPNFLSKYQYIQFKRFFHFNSIISILQLLAIYNICSPLLSLLAPLLGVIVPYFVLYFKGVKISFSNYMKFVKNIILKNYLINGILNFHKRSVQQNIYTAVSMFVYFMSIYNNILYCIEFYKNTNFIINFIGKYKSFIDESEKLIDNTIHQTKKLKKIKSFNKKLNYHKKNLIKMRENFSLIDNNEKRYVKYGKIGILLKYNFDIFYKEEFHDTIMYTIYLNIYLIINL